MKYLTNPTQITLENYSINQYRVEINYPIRLENLGIHIIKKISSDAIKGSKLENSYFDALLLKSKKGSVVIHGLYISSQ